MAKALLISLLPHFGAAATTTSKSMTCSTMKMMYKSAQCCGNPDSETGFGAVPVGKMLAGTNECDGAKSNLDLPNKACLDGTAVQVFEQSGTNVTKGYMGDLAAQGFPINTSYLDAGLCPVNVHWHLGAEHLSVGQYDEGGKGPATRRLAAGKEVRLGFRCHYYDADDTRFTTEYDWKHCVDMHVGETYEVHWPHSALGACGTPSQYQTPFYDGVLCRPSKLVSTHESIGVQGQVFTIINDEDYFYPDLIKGWIIDGDYGKDISYYTGSTTGTSRNNVECSQYSPITWQVDRTCHLISASTFDKMCFDMKMQRDDMSDDLHAHGARELVADQLAADNHQRL